MKYYYNGVKVRTSQNIYTHAIIRIERETKVIACCGCYDLAVKRLNQEINYFNQTTAADERFLRGVQKAIEGKEEGKEDKWLKFFEVNNKEELAEKFENIIESRKNEVQFKIVELKVRA